VATFILKNGLLPTFFQKLDIFGRVERLVETVLAKKVGFWPVLFEKWAG
jgi:hypothetical protein